jgi:hypothetical protein
MNGQKQRKKKVGVGNNLPEKVNPVSAADLKIKNLVL